MNEETLNELEMQNAELDQKMSISEKKALIAKAKQKYGKDYLKFFSNFMGKGSGIDWTAVKFRVD